MVLVRQQKGVQDELRTKILLLKSGKLTFEHVHLFIGVLNYKRGSSTAFGDSGVDKLSS